MKRSKETAGTAAFDEVPYLPKLLHIAGIGVKIVPAIPTALASERIPQPKEFCSLSSQAGVNMYFALYHHRQQAQRISVNSDQLNVSCPARKIAQR